MEGAISTRSNYNTIQPAWMGVIAIALGAFALVVTEFLPVGLLPGIARDLGITEGVAGLAVTATAVMGFLSAPVTAVVIRNADRRTVLLTLTGLLILSSAMASFASHFSILLLSRILLGIGVGGFWAISITAAATLVPPEKVHKASSLVFAGISIGSVVAVPAGSYIGAHADWRVAFMAAGVLAVAVALLQWQLLPRIVAKKVVNARDFLDLLRSSRIRAILLTVVFIVAGQYCGYTFVTPYLAKICNVSNSLLNMLLFAYGVVTVIGNFVGGAAAGRNLQRTVVVTVVIFLLSLLAFGFFAENIFIAGLSLMVWALSWGMAPVGTQLWLFDATQDAPEAAQAINTSVFQLSIGLGSLIGATAVDMISLRSSVWFGAATLCGALVMALIVGAIDKW
jgi:predicted MFS family arabinose efflux permease